MLTSSSYWIFTYLAILLATSNIMIAKAAASSSSSSSSMVAIAACNGRSDKKELQVTLKVEN